MKKIITILLILCSLLSIGQCVGIQSVSLTPSAVGNTYPPNTMITVCYTLNGFTDNNNANWLEGFQITGSGWSGLSSPVPPSNCNGGGGQWLWRNSVTSSSTGITAGPGWFFESPSGGPTDGNPGNDWGDGSCPCNNCVWTFCFTITTNNTCNNQPLIIRVTAGADGTWGSWGSNTCASPPYTAFNGTINTNVINTSQITHN